MWCDVVWCGMVWCGVMWCGVMWCGVAWCGVMWCGVVCGRSAEWSTSTMQDKSESEQVGDGTGHESMSCSSLGRLFQTTLLLWETHLLRSWTLQD